MTHFITEATLDPRGGWLRGLLQCETTDHISACEWLTPSDFLSTEVNFWLIVEENGSLTGRR